MSAEMAATRKTKAPPPVLRISPICLLALLVLVAGCSTLPEFARPKMAPAGKTWDPHAPALTYRRLAVTDFQADAAPKIIAAHEARINAHSCIRIRPTAATRFKVTAQRVSGKAQYFGSVEHIGFEAVLIPQCSWWNPHMPQSMRAYVLQHEQIHFAISELAARRLTRLARKFFQSYLAIRPTRKEALADLRAQIKRLMQKAVAESIKEHTAFDEDTSMSPSPRWQSWWLEKVTRRLAETEKR